MKKIILGLFVATAMISCDDDETSSEKTSTLEVKFDQVFGNTEFALNKEHKVSSNENVTLNTLKYIVGQFKFTKMDGSTFEPELLKSYLLVDESKANETKISFEVPEGHYTKVEFSVGVDPETSQADYAKVESYPALAHKATDYDMAWNWNLGYIFFKAEGKANTTATVMYHIGLYGRDGSVNNIRKVSLDLTDHVVVKNGEKKSLHILADIKKIWTGGAKDLTIEEHPKYMAKPESKLIADNYATIFSIDHAH